VTPDGLVWALVSVLVGGIGVLIGLMAVMKKELEFSTDLIALFAVLGFALIFTVSSGFLWLLVRTARGDSEDDVPERSEGRLVGEARQPHLLDAPPSVVEGTTRMFDPTASGERVEMKSRDTAGRSSREEMA